MNKVSDYFSPQAKAVVSAFLVFAAQILAFIGTGGYAELQALTLGQWIGIMIATLTAWGFTYAVPNAVQTPVVPEVVAEGKELAEAAQARLEGASPEARLEGSSEGPLSREGSHPEPKRTVY